MSVSGLITDPFSRVWNRRASAHTIHTRLRSEFAALRELHALSCGVKSSGWFSLFFFILVRNTLEACNKFQQNSQRRDSVFVPLRSLFLRLKAPFFCFYLRMSIITILHKKFIYFFFLNPALPLGRCLWNDVMVVRSAKTFTRTSAVEFL